MSAGYRNQHRWTYYRHDPRRRIVQGAASVAPSVGQVFRARQHYQQQTQWNYYQPIRNRLWVSGATTPAAVLWNPRLFQREERVPWPQLYLRDRRRDIGAIKTTGASVVVPTSPGLEFTASKRRLHYRASERRLHFTPPRRRLGYTPAEEDNK